MWPAVPSPPLPTSNARIAPRMRDKDQEVVFPQGSGRGILLLRCLWPPWPRRSKMQVCTAQTRKVHDDLFPVSFRMLRVICHHCVEHFDDELMNVTVRALKSSGSNGVERRSELPLGIFGKDPLRVIGSRVGGAARCLSRA